MGSAALEFGFVAPPFGALWPHIYKLLDKAVHKGGNEWADVVEGLEGGFAQLWLTLTPDEPVAAMVTRRDGDTLEVWLAGGAVLSTSVPFLETACEAAKQAGATSGRLTGRKGWQRVLRPFGWRPSGEDLVKDFLR